MTDPIQIDPRLGRLAHVILSEADWPTLRDFIFEAEDADFTVDESKVLAPRLLELAQRHRDSNDPQDKAAVWSAIRCGAAMLRPVDTRLLLPLLEPDDRIRVNIVAVKMLGRIFETNPPKQGEVIPEIKTMLRELNVQARAMVELTDDAMRRCEHG